MKWDLSTLYSSDQEFNADIEQAAYLRDTYSKDLKALPKEAILALQESSKFLKELEAYVSCLLAQDPNDSSAQEKNEKVAKELSLNEAALFSLGFFLKSMSPEEFNVLQSDKELIDLRFFLNEQRSIAQKKGDLPQENLITALSKDGYHSAWNLYRTVVNQIKIDGLSVGQAENKLSHRDRSVRLETFKKWNEAWEAQENLLAQILNQQAGFRLEMYSSRGWKDVVYEPLFLNRMSQTTLDAMREAIESGKEHLLKYLKHKAKLLGVEKLSWVDWGAPLSNEKGDIPYDKAWGIILGSFEGFHPRMFEFSKRCLEQNWVEAEDRPGKAPGGFCTFFPKKCQSRIFMTYTGTMINVATLAHELGHGYHNVCIENLPHFCQNLSMNVAETASTFAETYVMNALVAQAKDETEKKILLEYNLQRCVAYLLNLQSRFIFEKAFFEERKKGFVPVSRLKELIVDAQKSAFGDTLSDYAPYFWASKLHFYYTEYPFYNFPYTFGYLLSNALLARKDEENFPEKVDLFLADTGRMNAEDLVQKHLGADITKVDFWKSAMSFLESDVDQFLQI